MAKDDTQKQTEKITEYFTGVLSELKKVHWPDRRQLVAYTAVVFFAVSLISLLMWIVDNGLSFIVDRLLV